MVLAIWLYLVAARGAFWLARERDADVPPWDGPWPAVTAIIPARDEAACVGRTVASLLGQDYRGAFNLIVVDDQSRDGTAGVAREAAAAIGAGDRLTVVTGRALTAGWTGKLWAQHQGVELAEQMPQRPTYLLFTDADIVYAPDALSPLVARAQQESQRRLSDEMIVREARAEAGRVQREAQALAQGMQVHARLDLVSGDRGGGRRGCLGDHDRRGRPLAPPPGVSPAPAARARACRANHRLSHAGQTSGVG